MTPAASPQGRVVAAGSSSRVLAARVALLGGRMLAPYERPWLEALQERVEYLRVFVAEWPNRRLPWRKDFGKLRVTVLNALVVSVVHRHPSGFADPDERLIPYNAVCQLRRIRPDVIIAAELGAATLQAIGYARLRPSARVVIVVGLSERTEAGRGVLRRLLRRFLLRRADAIITIGSGSVRYLERFGVGRKAIFVMPRTTDMRPFLDLPLSRDEEGAGRLFFPGQFIQRKGLLPFLDVLSRWATAHRDRCVQFWLLGEGPERMALEHYPTSPNLSLRLWPGVPYDELPRFYGQAGILAFPTLADEWGLVVNEALASGVPVLGSEHSQAVVELVHDGETGWRFNPEKPDDTYEAIDRALSTPRERLAAMRAAARRSVETVTPELAADQVVEALHFALSGKRGG